MKKIITLLFILLSIPFYSQWVPQTSGVSVCLNDVYCITQDIVVVVGNGGTILKTIDGGANWVPKVSGTTNDLMKVDFVNTLVGYAVGNNGTVLKSINGGENWTVVPTDATGTISDLSCVDEAICYISSLGALKQTSNGGSTFTTVASNPYGEAVQFVNAMTGYSNSSGTLRKTVDGGISWSIIRENAAAFYFLNPATGYVNTTSGLQRTLDGGTTYESLGFIDYLMLDLFAPSENMVWGVTVELLLNGEPNYTLRGEFIDGQFERVDGPMYFRAIYFANTTKGYAVDWEGAIYKNSTGLMGVADNTLEYPIKMYPNPAAEQVTIALPQLHNPNFTIEISDSTGKKVFENSYQSDNLITINTASFASGVYILALLSEGARQSRKLVIK